MDQKCVLFTFDYELFLGQKSGSVDKCLIEPTNHLLQILNTNNKKGIFFIDTIYLIKLKEISQKYERASTDYKSILIQLKDMVTAGHYIFPHLHPHWFDAKYDDKLNEWDLSNFSKYCFASISEQERDYAFKQSMSFLDEIIAPINSLYQIDSYRAGGWSIQPFSDFAPYFKQYKIINDFSVIPGRYNLSTAHLFDFRNVPNKNIYRFEGDITREAVNGTFREFTISSIVLSNFWIWMNFKISGILKRLKIKPYGNGVTVNSETLEREDLFSGAKKKRYVASLEGLTLITLYKYIEAIRKNSYFQFISHPKLLTKHELLLFKVLLYSFRKTNIVSDYTKVKI